MDRRIIPVDDSPLRKRAASDCNRAMTKLEKARAELRLYERQDRPSFGRWMAATFGAMMTEIRENARVLREQEILINEVEFEMALSGHRHPRKAYAAVMKRRENPREHDAYPGAGGSRGEAKDGAAGGSGAGWEEEEEDFGAAGDMGAGVTQEQRRALFDDFVRQVLGLDPQKMGQAEYAGLFAEFQAEMFGTGRKPEPAQPRPFEQPRENGDQARIKETYRNLVRRLHPDLRADGDATVSAIWHEVQAAYEAGNLERLETLLALTEMEGGKDGGKTSLAHMRGALAELNRALRAIQRGLRDAKRDPAWGFSRNPYPGQMEKRIRREMEEILEDQQDELADFKRIIDDFSQPWVPPVRKQRSTGRPQPKPAAAERASNSSTPSPVQPELFTF